MFYYKANASVNEPFTTRQPLDFNRSNIDAMSDFPELNRHLRLDKGIIERLTLMPVS